MRAFNLPTCFDAVLMDDAISHMNCTKDFEHAIGNAHAYLKPGGVLVIIPDITLEDFPQNSTTTAHVKQADLDITFIENIYDPDPADEQYDTTIVSLIREGGNLRIESDHWIMGIFSMDTWRQVLRDGGFQVHEHLFCLDGDEYTVFACVKI